MQDLEAIKEEFNEDVRQSYNVPRDHSYDSIPLLRLLVKHNGDGVKVAKELLVLDKASYYDALKRLKKLKLLDYSIEALVLNKNKGYDQLFTDDELLEARRRLRDIDSA
jgi:hypothetical protein